LTATFDCVFLVTETYIVLKTEIGVVQVFVIFDEVRKMTVDECS
jgi:hypothetical protein